MKDLIILGSGCAGLTAALYAARANLQPFVLEGSQPGGQLTSTSEVENFPGFPEGINGFDLMDRMRRQAERFGATFAHGLVQSVDFSDQPLRLVTESESFTAQAVIIATGARPKTLGIPGESAMWGGKGVSTCATCDGAFYRGQEVIVVGGGDSAAEEALFLTHFVHKVYLVHRRDALRASRIMAARVLAHPKIEVIWNTAVEAVLEDDTGHCRGARLRDLVSGKVTELAAKGFFLAIGHLPNTHAFAGTLELDENGYLVPSLGSQVKTAIPGVFVAGDCADHVFRQAITAAGMGCQAAIEAERWLAARKELVQATTATGA